MEPRSTFVTVLAWIFIIGAGFASFVSAMQVIMVTIMFSGDEFRSIPDDAPVMAKVISQYFHLFVYGFCALSLFTFVSSIALLKRKNWARLVFIAILVLGIFWQLGGLAMQYFMFSGFPVPPEGEGFDEFGRMVMLIRWFSFAMTIAFTVLFIWIIRKLSTQPIIGEFVLEKSRMSNAVDGDPS